MRQSYNSDNRKDTKKIIRTLIVISPRVNNTRQAGSCIWHQDNGAQVQSDKSVMLTWICSVAMKPLYPFRMTSYLRVRFVQPLVHPFSRPSVHPSHNPSLHPPIHRKSPYLPPTKANIHSFIHSGCGNMVVSLFYACLFLCVHVRRHIVCTYS